MSAPDASAASENEPTPTNLVEAGVYRSASAGFEHGLVVLAMGQPCWLVADVDGHHLLVEPADAAAVQEQLARFDRESLRWPPRPIVRPAAVRKIELGSPLLWAAAVLAAFWFQATHADAVALGALDAEAIFAQGEWWRLGTALFLHADVAHLTGNLISGVFVFGALCATLSRRRGWLLLTLASLAGNLAVAALHYGDDYRSIGASTAVFAGLGLLTGHAIRRADHPHRWRALFVPLAAGITLLGLLGAGGIQTDVLAHLTGFACGLLLGVVTRPDQTGAAGATPVTSPDQRRARRLPPHSPP